LVDAGFTSVAPDEALPTTPGRWVAPREGAVLAWIVPEGVGPGTPFHIVGAHTDSPNLRLKPHPNADVPGFRRTAVEVYGGVLLNSWLDRDLGLSGRVSVRGSDRNPDVRLVNIDQPLFRLPQLAIHLDRDVNDKGPQLNKQLHVSPVYGDGSAPSVLALVAAELGVSEQEIIGFDLMFHDTQPSQLIGVDSAFISAPRLDNQLSCHAAITALSGTTPNESIPVVALFDHEEVGSVSVTGAASDALPRLLRGISDALGGNSDDLARALDGSLFVSADNAHATHPNHPERHDPAHPIFMNGGPVLKFNANQRYTTDAVSAGVFRLAAERAGVETQSFVSRGDMPCGSTIGPTVAASLAVRALDVGCAQLAMHSAREMAGTNDPWDMTLILADLLG
jgi:aspartyl aminopeptidase